MLASIFVLGGLDTLRDPGRVVKPAERVGVPIAEKIPGLPTRPETLVRINGGVQCGAGVMLALGKLPRLSSFALLCSLAPTTAAGHAFWEEDDDVARATQRIHFLKNLGLAGGLLLSAFDADASPPRGVRKAKPTGDGAARAARRRAAAGSAASAAAAAASAGSAARRAAADRVEPALQSGRAAAGTALQSGSELASTALRTGRAEAAALAKSARKEARRAAKKGSKAAGAGTGAARAAAARAAAARAAAARVGDVLPV
jgi:uncharacterized membrane protein YphA (DoxX/SURF4 family)